MVIVASERREQRTENEKVIHVFSLRMCQLSNALFCMNLWFVICLLSDMFCYSFVMFWFVVCHVNTNHHGVRIAW